ncbi:TolC family protein [Methylocaldum sp. BRCS4]|jgi:cobalt-zinc-cadmium efflux system outer membrane protein|uniref:TolC family protein n=1 Tax=unclassified Methylocaldum TaxID=2622260 RepID=UPI0012EC21DA|nr:TolC family protein [Methylocaldum sp. BRCS4]
MLKPNRSRCRFGILLAVALWSLAAAGEQAEPRLDLERLVQETLENNPDIQSARQRFEAARAVIPQVRTLPDPKINLGYREVVEREAMYGVSQEIPFPGKLGLRGEVAASEADRIEQEYLAVQLNVVAQLKEAFYNLHLVHKSLEVVRKNLGLLQNFEKTAKARYMVGQGTQQDVFRAQTEISRVLQRLAILEQQGISLRAEINQILRYPPTRPLGVPQEIRVTPLEHNPVEIQALIEQAAPLLRAQMKDIERSENAIALAKREYFPDFELSALGLRNETMRRDGYQVMLGVRVPLYYATKQRYGVKEAVARREAALQDWWAVKQALSARVQDNLARAQRAEELVKLLAEVLIPQARLTLASAQASYAVGKVDFLTLLNSLLTLQENEIELHGEMTEHEKALARLEEIIGERP